MSPSPMSPPPSAPDTKNLAIAIALSLAILLGFQYFYEMPREKARMAEMAQKREAQAAAQKAAAAQPAVTPVQAAASSGQPVSRPDALGLSQRINIDADAKAPHQAVMSALEAARDANLANIVFSSQTTKK